MNNKSLIELGKATKRGVRKCPRCLTLNGVRSLKCKNIKCQSQLNGKHSIDNGNRCSVSSAGTVTAVTVASATELVNLAQSSNGKTTKGLDCVQIINKDTMRNIFSIRVREKGPEYRGFVEVPNVNGLNNLTDPSLDPKFMQGTISRCFIETCCRDMKTNKLRSTKRMRLNSTANKLNSNVNITVIETCDHIKDAINCVELAMPLRVHSQLIEKINLDTNLKQSLRNELKINSVNNVYLVQKVSRKTFVLPHLRKFLSNNCGNQINFIHCSFNCIPSQLNELNEVRKKFHCQCKEFKGLSKVNNRDEKEKLTNAVDNHRKCVHYYICLIAFIYDKQLRNEFKNCIYEIINENIFTSELINFNDEISFCEQIRKTFIEEQFIFKNNLKSTNFEFKNEINYNLTFKQWLISVVELINQTMHYQLSGKPDALVFTIPNYFFKLLQQRFILENDCVNYLKRNRLIANVTTIYHRQTPPIGKFTKYTYLFTDVKQIENIFTIDQFKINLTQQFTKNSNNQFHFISSTFLDKTCNSNERSSSFSSSSSSLSSLRPTDYKTFLIVGQQQQFKSKSTSPTAAAVGETSVNSSDSGDGIPFTIEWTPDLLPSSKFGELRIQFQFGHLKNGEFEFKE